ncbi:acyltransferase, partial [Pseudomonadales bacterium]|nr:acyltransferase [Pseudomonadales bacterium]
MANREDECTGRFWEGRFRSQALLDEASILACMVYVDLNPVRAGMSQSLDECEFTSIKRRLEETSVDDPMTALGKQAVIPSISAITLDNYLELVFWTQD